jgi:heterodisulfide reductase subunit A
MKEIAAILDLAVDENGFLKEQDPHDPVVSGRPGVFFAGCCESPKDITDSVSQASGAAAKALAVISKVHG